MNRCPITYDNCGEHLYGESGLKSLSPVLRELYPLEFTAEELRREAMIRAQMISIQGVQPKLSAVLNIKEGRFDLVDKYGRYILKPQHHIFPELPQNEDLSMRLAKCIGIEIPLHGMVYSKDHTLTYFIKRFDREGQKDKIHIEDFAQLAGMSRETKYNYSMERLVKLIDDYCTFPAVEKIKLFRLVIFNFIIGNEDMHLKNYSIICRNNKTELSPAYDLLNSSIILEGDLEEIALTIKGTKKKLNSNLLIEYFGKERSGLTNKTIEQILDIIRNALPTWYNLIEISFLSSEMKEKYSLFVQQRSKIFGWY